MRVDTCFLWVDTGVTDLIQTGIDCRAVGHIQPGFGNPRRTETRQKRVIGGDAVGWETAP